MALVTLNLINAKEKTLQTLKKQHYNGLGLWKPWKFQFISANEKDISIYLTDY